MIKKKHWEVYTPCVSKGQLISKGLFDVIIWTKTEKKFQGFLPQPLKRGQIKKIKALYIDNQGLFNIII